MASKTISVRAKHSPYFDIVGLPSPLKRDGRHIPQTSIAQFVGLLAVIPVWLGLYMPFCICYQLTKWFLRKVGILKIPPWPPLDSGMAAPETIQPRSERKYDIVVLGVTGFTGRLAARNLAQKYGTDGPIKWAIAGRSEAKLDATKQSLAEELKVSLDSIDTIVVDTSDPKTMPSLVEDTRVVATTAGPYQEYGSSVVEFCAKYGTHYTDITGEVDWVKAMMVQWQDVAKKTGSKIVPFCGHDSIPWDLTVYRLNNLLKTNYNDQLASVKIWNEIVADVPGGTYATILLTLDGRAMKAPRCAVDPFLQLYDTTKSTHSTTEDLPLLLDPFFDGRWTSPFVMAIVNSKIVRWTHALRQQGVPKLSYREVMVHRDFKTAFSFLVGDLLMPVSLLLTPITTWLAYKIRLLPAPGSGPSCESMLQTNYLLVTAEGMGAQGNRAESTFYFPQDPGCLETARMMMESAIVLALNEQHAEKKKQKELPSGDLGGFWTPAAALGDVLMDRLIQAGAEYNSLVVAKPVPKDKTE